MRYLNFRKAAGFVAFGILLACVKGEASSADSAAAVTDAATDAASATTTSTTPNTSADTAATYPGPDQMPATAKPSVSGAPPDDGWNGSWTVNSKVSGCGINTYPKMINFDIIDETAAAGAGGFREVSVRSNDGPDVGGSTSKFVISLGLERPIPNLSINPANSRDDTGTLTILENAKGYSRFKVTARSSRGVQFEGEFTCVPRPPQG